MINIQIIYNLQILQLTFLFQSKKIHCSLLDLSQKKNQKMTKWSVKLSSTCSLNFFEALLRHIIVKETRTKIEHRHTIGSKPTFVKSSKGSMSRVCTKSLGLGRNLRPVGRVDARERKREKERQRKSHFATRGSSKIGHF